jgi:hypothetical protein
MAILRVKEVRKRERAPRATERINDLSAEESKNVLAALKVMRIRRGSWAALATEMRVPKPALEAVAGGNKRLSAGFALRVAKLAGVSSRTCSVALSPSPEAVPCAGAVVTVKFLRCRLDLRPL